LNYISKFENKAITEIQIIKSFDFKNFIILDKFTGLHLASIIVNEVLPDFEQFPLDFFSITVTDSFNPNQNEIFLSFDTAADIWDNFESF